MRISILGVVFVQCACFVSSQAITAWYNTFGPQIFHQNVTTGDLVYTLNTGSGNEEKFIPWTRLTLSIPPKKGTPLSATAYPGGDDQVGASIFYLSAANSVLQVQILCNQTSGKVTQQRGPWTLSAVVTAGVNASTGLAASLRNASDGDRVFYHDNVGATQMLRYSAPKRLDWGPNTLIIPSAGQQANAIATDSGANQTTYSIDESGKIVSATVDANETWITNTGSPDNLPAWSPVNVSIAATASIDNSTRTLYYIGIDRAVHQVVSTDQGQTWNVTASQPSENWPLSDVPNAPFGLATADYSGEALSLFYFSAGDLVQLNNYNGVWQKAKAIKGLNTTNTNDASAKKTSNAVKIGAGVGVGVGIPVLAAIVIAAILLRRRRKAAKASKFQHSTYPYENPIVHEVHGRSVAQEVPGGSQVQPQVHELDSALPGAKAPKDSNTQWI